MIILKGLENHIEENKIPPWAIPGSNIMKSLDSFFYVPQLALS